MLKKPSTGSVSKTSKVRASVVAISALIAVLAGSASYTWVLISRREAALRELSGYNVGHSFSQAALEFARLQAAVGAYAMSRDEADWARTQLWLDIVAGRLQSLQTGAAGTLLRSEPELLAVTSELAATVTEARPLAEMLREPDAAERLMGMLVGLSPKMTRLAAVAHVRGGELTTRELQALSRLNRIFSGVLISLVACGFILAGLLIRSNRLLRRAYRDVQRLLSDLRRAGSELTAAHERLAHAQRMEALGRLAGGVAHDFNNVLQAVLGGTRLIARRPDDAQAVLRLARMIFEAAERGASVTRRLLAFGRQGDLRAEILETGQLLEGLNEVLTHTLGGTVSVCVEAPAKLPPLFADRGQLETVLVNLAVNARDAMASLGGGTVLLSAAVEEVGSEGEQRVGLSTGRYIRFAVTDTGCGMDAATLARAAEPFFTTKPKGKGTGLGLAMAKGFAEQSGGAMQIDSMQGRGTTVTLWLPCASETAAFTSAPDNTKLNAELPAGAGFRLLLVDDEPEVRMVVAEGLRDHGFAVEEVDSGRAALTQLRGHPGFHLLITDLAMPGMDGLELLRNARTLQPELPAVLLTGYAGDVAEAPLLTEDKRLVLLHKPVPANEIAGRILELLSTSDASNAA